MPREKERKKDRFQISRKCLSNLNKSGRSQPTRCCLQSSIREQQLKRKRKTIRHSMNHFAKSNSVQQLARLRAATALFRKWIFLCLAMNVLSNLFICRLRLLPTTRSASCIFNEKICSCLFYQLQFTKRDAIAAFRSRSRLIAAFTDLQHFSSLSLVHTNSVEQLPGACTVLIQINKLTAE